MIDGLVSAIIIFLNAEKYLAEAVQSVFDQVYEGWELLLVDDGSTDGSAEIAQRFAREHPEKVRVLEHPGHENRGMSVSRNLGIQHARGEYVAFLDADDVWKANILEEQVKILRSQPEAAMVYGPIEWWYSWTDRPEDSQRDFVEFLGVPPETVIEPPRLFNLFLQDKAAVPSGMLVRRSIIDQVGGFEDSFRSFYEDQVFLAKVCLNAPVYASGESWYRYRQHDGASCSLGHTTGEYFSARQVYLEWLRGYLSSQSISDPEVWKALERELWPYRHPTRHRMNQWRRERSSQLQQIALSAARRVIPSRVYQPLSARWQARRGTPPAGWVQFGNLRRVTPFDREWGIERGFPIDRYYIERFLEGHAFDVCGRVLEIGGDHYTHQFGGVRVSKSEVLHVQAGDPQATIIADLTSTGHIPSNAFDCIILTQTLHLIYDARGALKTLHRILKPGGVLLLTVPGISQISRYDHNRWGDYWRFTTQSARLLLEESFSAEGVEVTSYGNVLAAASFLYGLAADELHPEELDACDQDYEVLIAARAVKPDTRIPG